MLPRCQSAYEAPTTPFLLSGAAWLRSYGWQSISLALALALVLALAAAAAHLGAGAGETADGMEWTEDKKDLDRRRRAH